MSMVLGPILQFRGLQDKAWWVSALMVLPKDSAAPVVRVQKGLSVKAAQRIGQIPFNAPRFDVYRVDLNLELGQRVGYFSVDQTQYSFHASAKSESPRMAYASCNGFSDPKLMKSIDVQNDRWIDLQRTHEQQPYHVLMLGGDQIYSDEMWKRIKPLEVWSALSLDKRCKAAFTVAMNKGVDDLFCDLYLSRWAQPEVARTLSSIPTLMMWDDHDIFDGWGSYPAQLHDCAVFQGIFHLARRYFRLFQLQCEPEREAHPRCISPQGDHLGFSRLGDLGILALDLRTERQPQCAKGPNQIVSPAAWQGVFDWLDAQTGLKHLLVMSSIPVAYLDLNLLEKTLSILPGRQELEDDLRDHWRSEAHRQERLRLIHRLFQFAQAQGTRVTLLSGDVHVGAVAAIVSTREATAGNAAVINQLIASGIVHPPPPALARYVLETLADKPEPVDRSITSTMQRIAEKGTYLISQRHWLAIEPDASGRLWANWHIEGQTAPMTKVIHAVRAVS